jgi:hypothetical protein
VIEGPLWAARNWSADAGEGSIHDDATAARLGFRGGTVAGDVHMNQFAPVLEEVFGRRWFECGHLSLAFRNATVDGEQVRVFAEPLADGASTVRVWMERVDGMLVCAGTAGVGDHSHSELRTRDLRPCAPNALRILHRLSPGMPLGTWDVDAAPTKQFQRYDANLISDPHPWFRKASPWGGAIAAPCTVLEFLWQPPMEAMRPLVGESVGLFGAIEIGFHAGPMLLDRQYRVSSEVVCVGQSPQTEYVWYDSEARDATGRLVTSLRMQSRVMKASSAAYR